MSIYTGAIKQKYRSKQVKLLFTVCQVSLLKFAAAVQRDGLS